MKINHTLGGIFLVAGTSIGAGMLAIPIGTGFMGFFPSIILFLACWLFFLVTAVFFIDVNDSVKVESNLITMAGKTLGLPGQIFTWGIYLLLLYSLTAAYIAGSAPLFQASLAYIHVHVPLWLCYLALPLVFGAFVYLGTEEVDIVNRLLMTGLIGSYLFLILGVPQQIQTSNLLHFDSALGVIGLPIVITAFGYHIILPTLGTYLKHNRKKLIQTVIFGSLMTLFVYIIWQMLVLGVVPLTGKTSLAQTWFYEGGSAATPLAKMMKNSLVSTASYFFSFFAIITSFLGVSLSLVDFVSDGFRLKKGHKGRLLACAITFVPPIFFVLSYERGFIMALEYAGIFVILLLGILPACMALKIKKPSFYTSALGKFLVLSIIVISLGALIIVIGNQIGTFNHLLLRYRG